MSFERGDVDAAEGGGVDMFVVGLAGFPPLPSLSVAEVLASLQPGPAAIGYLHSLNVAELDAEARVAVLQAWEAQAAWLAAESQPVLAAVAGPAPTEFNDDDWGTFEVAAALRLSSRTAQDRVHVARTLTTTLGATLSALRAGAITTRHAAVLVEECLGLPAAVMSAVEARVLPKAAGQTLGQFGRAVRKAIMAVTPVHAELAREQAVAGRRVWLAPEPDGMATLGALLPAEQATAIYRLVDQHAEQSTGAVDAYGAKLGVDARRADALAAMLLGERPAGAGEGAVRPRVPVELQVVIDLPTLLGLADHPADLPGYGPIPAASPASWPKTPAGGGCSPTPPSAGCSTTDGAATGHPPRWPSSCAPATAAAASPAASSRPSAATSITACPTARAAAPARPTAAASVDATTG